MTHYIEVWKIKGKSDSTNNASYLPLSYLDWHIALTASIENLETIAVFKISFKTK